MIIIIMLVIINKGPLKLSEIRFLYNPNQTYLLHWQITNLNCRHLKRQTNKQNNLYYHQILLVDFHVTTS